MPIFLKFIQFFCMKRLFFVPPENISDPGRNNAAVIRKYPPHIMIHFFCKFLIYFPLILRKSQKRSSASSASACLSSAKTGSDSGKRQSLSALFSGILLSFCRVSPPQSPGTPLLPASVNCEISPAASPPVCPPDPACCTGLTYCADRASDAHPAKKDHILRRSAPDNNPEASGSGRSPAGLPFRRSLPERYITGFSSFFAPRERMPSPAASIRKRYT